MKYKTIDTDILILGGGVSGLRAAVAAVDSGMSVAVVSKGSCASPDIMGLIAPVLPDDSEELYFSDFNKSGYRINDVRLAHVLSRRIMDEVRWLESNSMHFARDKNGEYLAIRTLGASFPRLIKAGVSSGVQEMRVLLALCKKYGVRQYTGVDILELMGSRNRVTGAYGMEKGGALLFFRAKSVVLALGGCGAMQSFATYPKALIGDGYAMAYNLGASLTDMEFQQFEPCCFVFPESIRGKVIATTLLRHGGRLLNGDGREFMSNYGLTENNAQKGNLARAMLREVKAGRGTPHGGIYYDMRSIDESMLYKDHEIFTRPAREAGLDLKKEMPEMMPAAHTNLGGVVIDNGCATEIPGLFACGEVTGGLHGANRLGGSAGAETIVFGRLAGENALQYAFGGNAISEKDFAQSVSCVIEGFEKLLNTKGSVCPEEVSAELGNVLHKHMGIERDAESIRKAAELVKKLEIQLANSEIQSMSGAAKYIHCQHMLLLANMQIKASEMRKESRGVFYRKDYPQTDDLNWRKNIIIKKVDGEMELTVRDAVSHID